MARIYNRAREDAMPFLPLQSVEHVTRFLRNVVRDDTTLVAEDASTQEIVAFIAFNEESVTFLFVEPDWQRMGIGSDLLDRAKEGRCRVDVWTFQRNDLGRQFYERRGFAAVEFTDGSNNDKGEPEVLYCWSAAN